MSPMPPLSRRPSLCRCRRRSVSRASRGCRFPSAGSELALEGGLGVVSCAVGVAGFGAGSGALGRSLECGLRSPARSMRCLRGVS